MAGYYAVLAVLLLFRCLFNRTDFVSKSPMLNLQNKMPSRCLSQVTWLTLPFANAAIFYKKCRAATNNLLASGTLQVVQILHICEKVYFDQLLGFSRLDL